MKRKRKAKDRDHCRLWDGTKVYCDKSYALRDPRKPYSLELIQFYRDQETGKIKEPNYA